LEAKPSSPVVLEENICELGKPKSQIIYLENPTEDSVELHVNNSNTNNFIVF
jgi:hypothetical protein